MSAPRSRTEFSVQSFGDVSRILGSAIADEESRELRQSVGLLAQQIEDIVRLRRGTPAAFASLGRPDETRITQEAARLAQTVQAHQRLLTGLGSAWHGLYEMGAYESALRSLRRAIDVWHGALMRRSSAESSAYAHLEPLAWRTLGEGLLLIEMYEHGGGTTSQPGALSEPPTPPRGHKLRFWKALLKLLGRSRAIE